MVSDKDLLIDAMTTYSHLDMATAAKNLAHDYSLQYDSVRGRLSRARSNHDVRTAVTKHIATTSSQLPPSVVRQLGVIDDSVQEWAKWQVDEDRRGMFVSDMHLPYTRWDAYELTLKIGDSFRPHLVSAFNDVLDNKGFGRHEDSSPVYTQLWRGDIENTYATLSSVHSDMHSILADDGKLVAVMGNHDNWLFKFWRKWDKQTAERNIAEFMDTMYREQGVLMFSRGIHEPPLQVSPGLVWVHGLSAAKNANSTAKKAFSHFMGNDGRAKSVVQGHTHRAIQVNGLPLGYRGVTFTNSGHLRDTSPEWMKHKAVDWVMGIVLCEYNPMKWKHDVHLVVFEEVDDVLRARYKGQEWTVKIDHSKPY